MNKLLIIVSMALCMGFSLTSCSDANEYEDTNTANPSWSNSETVAHPESLTNTLWVRGSGLKKNAYGEEIQGFVESLDFVKADSVKVKMSQGILPSSWTSDQIVWVDESNTEKTPLYEYTYSNITGKLEILKRIVDEKGKVSKTAIFTGIAVSGTQEVLTVSHFGDTPVQSYLIKQ